MRTVAWAPTRAKARVTRLSPAGPTSQASPVAASTTSIGALPAPESVELVDQIER